MYRLLIETLLGVNLAGDKLRLTPRLPKDWATCKIHYRYRQTVYHITINRFAADPAEANQLFLDGKKNLPRSAVRRWTTAARTPSEVRMWTPVKTVEPRSVLSPAV